MTLRIFFILPVAIGLGVGPFSIGEKHVKDKPASQTIVAQANLRAIFSIFDGLAIRNDTFVLNKPSFSSGNYRYTYTKSDSLLSFEISRPKHQFLGIINQIDSFRMDPLSMKVIKIETVRYTVRHFWNRHTEQENRIVYYFVDELGLIMSQQSIGIRQSTATSLSNFDTQKLAKICQQVSEDNRFKAVSDSIFKIQFLFSGPK